MAGLSETPTWVEEVYQLKTTDPALGGAPDLDQGLGILNVPNQQLAMRTLFLHQAIGGFTALVGSTVGASKVVWSSDGALMKNATNEGIEITGATQAELIADGLEEFFSLFASEIVGSSSPAGAVTAFAKSAPPIGWLECDGAALSRASYAKLFGAIGTEFGIGDGVNTFNLPDLRGEFIRGWDNGRGVNAGRAFGSEELDAFQAHMHNLYPLNGVATLGNFSSGTYRAGLPDAGSYHADGSNGLPRTASETRPRNVALMFCIKY